MGSDDTKNGSIVVELEFQSSLAGLIAKDMKPDVRVRVATRKEGNPSTLCCPIVHFQIRVRARKMRCQGQVAVISVRPQHVEDERHIVDASDAAAQIEHF